MCGPAMSPKLFASANECDMAIHHRDDNNNNNTNEKKTFVQTKSQSEFRSTV
jgi:hypothetical protein